MTAKRSFQQPDINNSISEYCSSDWCFTEHVIEPLVYWNEGEFIPVFRVLVSLIHVRDTGAVSVCVPPVLHY